MAQKPKIGAPAARKISNFNFFLGDFPLEIAFWEVRIRKIFASGGRDAKIRHILSFSNRRRRKFWKTELVLGSFPFRNRILGVPKPQNFRLRRPEDETCQISRSPRSQILEIWNKGRSLRGGRLVLILLIISQFRSRHRKLALGFVSKFCLGVR